MSYGIDRPLKECQKNKVHILENGHKNFIN